MSGLERRIKALESSMSIAVNSRVVIYDPALAGADTVEARQWTADKPGRTLYLLPDNGRDSAWPQ